MVRISPETFIRNDDAMLRGHYRKHPADSSSDCSVAEIDRPICHKSRWRYRRLRRKRYARNTSILSIRWRGKAALLHVCRTFYISYGVYDRLKRTPPIHWLAFRPFPWKNSCARTPRIFFCARRLLRHNTTCDLKKFPISEFRSISPKLRHSNVTFFEMLSLYMVSIISRRLSLGIHLR